MRYSEFLRQKQHMYLETYQKLKSRKQTISPKKFIFRDRKSLIIKSQISNHILQMHDWKTSQPINRNIRNSLIKRTQILIRDHSKKNKNKLNSNQNSGELNLKLKASQKFQNFLKNKSFFSKSIQKYELNPQKKQNPQDQKQDFMIESLKAKKTIKSQKDETIVEQSSKMLNNFDIVDSNSVRVNLRLHYLGQQNDYLRKSSIMKRSSQNHMNQNTIRSYKTQKNINFYEYKRPNTSATIYKEYENPFHEDAIKPW